MIRENILHVHENINNAAAKALRDPSEVALISVTKTKPVEMLREAYEAGERDFGENKVQELMNKMPVLPSDIRWHMIGHLQRNKVKYIVGKVALIHSVDSYRLAEEINKEALKKGVVADILLQVNLSMEESKSGTTTEEAIALAEAVSTLPGVRVKGLMTVPPFVTDPEDNRVYFRKLRELSVDINSKNIDNISMNILSMGMTGDYTVAVEEGATHVRVGTGIFGERHYDTVS